MSAAAYDLAVIGSGPAGQKGAIAASKLGHRVAIIDRKEMVGGVCLHTGTIPSKTLREAILYLTGFSEKTFYGRDYTLRSEVTVADLAFRVQKVLAKEMEVVRSQLARNHIATLHGAARFVDAHTLEITPAEGDPSTVKAEKILIACGTRPAHHATVPLDGDRIVDSDQLLHGKNLPRNVIVVGAGVIGLEYASMLTALNIKTTIVEARPTMLDFVDREMIEALTYFMRQRGAVFRLGEKVVSVGYDDKQRVVASLESGKELHGDWLLYTVGRQTNADLMNLAGAGLEADSRGRIAVNEFFQTAVPHIYAAGDVIGFPALASTSMEQGRLASCHMFGASCESRPHTIPYGIYTIPEISMVGKTEQELTEAKIPYEIGVSKFEELAKGQMLGLEAGLLKLLFDPKSRKLLGVHAFGERATEIIHIGQAVLAYGGTIEYFRDTVFNYPTMAEAYKVAGLDGLNRL
ncbi:MAG TPA: Si-specific NAD(P)(+) transhydrogenase [Thermoanaerobaculia bacterium]|jgi:NAD(P) transhydrogenase|nr:Si-specific NAD(P)(+) transhydrogenase [Thermoanaerobaculia bacterium]